MSYAFKFDAYDLNPAPDDEGYNSGRKNSVEVAVIAGTETEARDAAKELITRQNYKLESVSELSDTRPVSSRW